MIVGIVGSRDYTRLDRVVDYVNGLPEESTVVSGGARGVDRIAETSALERELDVVSYRPKKTTSGLYIIEVWRNESFDRADGHAFSGFASAAFFRNGLIVRDVPITGGGAVVAFWDGESRGTKDSIDKARAAHRRVLIIHADD